MSRMKKTFLYLVIIFSLITGCTTNQNKQNEKKVDATFKENSAIRLKGTTWFDKYNSISFISSDSLKIHLGEPGDDHLGNYFIKNDTVYISIKKGLYDDEFPIGSHHRVTPYKFKLLISDSILTNGMDIYSKKIK